MKNIAYCILFKVIVHYREIKIKILYATVFIITPIQLKPLVCRGELLFFYWQAVPDLLIPCKVSLKISEGAISTSEGHDSKNE